MEFQSGPICWRHTPPEKRLVPSLVRAGTERPSCKPRTPKLEPKLTSVATAVAWPLTDSGKISPTISLQTSTLSALASNDQLISRHEQQ
jgi:hypothetical protein